MFSAILDSLFPPRCATCGRYLLAKNELYFCEDCHPKNCMHSGKSRALIDLNREAAAPAICLGCGETAHSLDCQSRCTLCMLCPLPIHRLVSLYYYSGVIVPALKAFKYQQAVTLRKFFGELLVEAYKRTLSVANSCTHDCIIPIPSPNAAMRKRGYHHTQLAADVLARGLCMKSSPFILLPAKSRKAQAKLNTKQRMKNMRGAFRLNSKKLAGQRVLLVDDILTTGATIFEATRLLTEAGAQVDAMTIARSPNFIRYRLESASFQK